MNRRDQVLSSGEYKIIKKILRREFPFIKDVVPSIVLDEYKTVTYLDIVLDTPKFEKALGVQMSNIVKDVYKDEIEKGTYNTSYLPSAYRNEDRETLIDYTANVREIIQRISRSSVVPDEMKLIPKPNISDHIFN